MNYNPKAIIYKNWIEMHVPALSSVDSFKVENNKKIVEEYNKTVKISNIDYVKTQLARER